MKREQISNMHPYPEPTQVFKVRSLRRIRVRTPREIGKIEVYLR